MLDVWQADPQGRYEAQVDTAQARLRGRYTSQSGGTYCLRTVAPLGYSIPMDGPVGQLISRTGISHHRPAHVHFLITAPDYEPLITQLFEKGAPVPRLRRRVRHQGPTGGVAAGELRLRVAAHGRNDPARTLTTQKTKLIGT